MQSMSQKEQVAYLTSLGFSVDDIRINKHIIYKCSRNGKKYIFTGSRSPSCRNALVSFMTTAKRAIRNERS